MRKFYTNRMKLLGLLVTLTFLSPSYSQTDVTIGAGSNTGTTANGATTDAGPMYNTGGTSAFIYSKHFYVYTASELATGGIPAGTLITKVAWYKANNAAYSSSSAAIFQIYLKNSSATGVPGTVPQDYSTLIAGATEVYTTTSQTFPATIGWVEFTLSTPFLYTGGALELTTNWDISAGGSTAAGSTGNFAWAKDPGTNILSHAAATQSANFTFLRTSRAQIKFTYTPAGPCTSPPTPGAATANPVTVCAGAPVALNLTGQSLGTGQTYVWQSFSTAGGPYTDISASSGTANTTTNPTVTKLYRAAVTCGGVTRYSDSIEVVVNPALPGGTYSIHGGIPTGGTNFQTFGEAVSALSCGIAGPVVFDVEPGTYNEQVVIPAIAGASATNTIKFRGNLATLSFASTNTANRGGIILNGADHVTIDSLIIDGSTGTYAWGVVLTGQADSNTISNCVILLSTTNTTATNFLGIAINGSTSATSTSGNNGNNNKILNNTITGGYYGMFIYGSSTAGAQNVNNLIRGNTVTDAYGHGIYTLYQSGAVIDSNDISRPTRTAALSGGSGVYVSTGDINVTVSRNRIHNMFDAATTSTATLYNIYVSADGTSGQENKIINNLIYNSGGNGIFYGIYNTGGAYMQAFHNTIVIDDQVATTGTAYGFYQTGAATDIAFRNNIVVIGRSGTGIKRALYFVTTTSAIQSNNNVLLMTSTGGTNNHLGQYGTTNFTTLVDWKTANSGAYDQQSESIDPLFTSPTAVPADFTPMEPTINNIGAAVGVSIDILGNGRSGTNPDPGAYEFSLLTAGTNMGAEALITPAVSAKGCYTNSETITIRIRNNSLSTHDFAVKPVTVTVNITGAASQVLTHSINTGTLASDATMNVVMPGTANLSAAGVYSIDASTSVAGDVNAANDAMPTASRTNETLTAGTTAASSASHCVSASANPVLSTAGALGYSTLQWQHSTTSGSGFVDITGGTVTPFTIPGSITQTTYYRLVASCGSVTDISPQIQIDFLNPQVTSTTPASRCGVGTANLAATASPGTTLNWYTTASGGLPVATGNNFTTPVLSSTTDFYVAASAGGITTNIGLPAAITTTSTGTGTTNFGLVFDVYAPFTLNTVTVYPVSASSAAGTITIDVINGSGAIVHQAVVNVQGSPSGSVVPQTVNLNFNIQPGTNYKLRPGSFTGISSLLFEPSASAPAGNYGYPFSVPGVVSILTSTLTAAPTNTARNDLYYYFYNWQISTGCESSRTVVTATVTPAPALTVTANKTICNNAVHMLEVTSNTAEFNSYTWSPQAGLYTDASATVPYTGGSATQVYVKTTSAGAVTYTLTAENSSTQCANQATTVVTVLPDPTIASSVPEICMSGSAGLSLSPATGYGAAGFQWQNSPNGSAYTDIGGATSSSYTTPVVTQTTYYKLILKDQAGATCSQSPTFTLVVNNPQVTGTTPGARCGPGTVDLGATGNAGSTLNWYTAASGGTSVASGPSFTTPPISSTATYYVSATSGGGGTSSLGKANRTDMTANTNTNSGLVFSAPSGGVLQSVSVYPSGTGAGTLTVTLKTGNTASATVIATTTVNITGAPIAGTPKTVVPLNFTVPPGTNYYLSAEAWSGGVAGLGRELTGGGPFPYTSPTSDWQITASWLTTGAPSTTTHYYYFYDWVVIQGCESARTPVTATVTNPASNAAGASGTTECASATIAGTTDFNYTDCDPIATLTPSGASAIAGSVNACVTIDASVQTAPGGEQYVQRHYDITPAVNPATATSTLKLFFLQSEFTAFNAANVLMPDLPTGPADAAGIANLRITQYNGTGTTPGTYTGTPVLINPADASIVYNSTAGRWEITLDVTGSGGFYVHTRNFILPVTLVNFRGEQKESLNRLLWTTSTETNNRGFELERSADGRTFSSIGFIATKAENGNSASAINYSFDDVKPIAGNNYYRLKQVDKEGKFSYSNTVLLSGKVTEITLSRVYPNPARAELNLQITAPSAEQVTILVTDLSGKVVMLQVAALKPGNNQQQLDIQHLAQGTYVIRAVCANGCESAVHKFVKL